MPLSEKKIAELLMKYVIGDITPDERDELMKGYVNSSAENRLHFNKLTDPNTLKTRLQQFKKHQESYLLPSEDNLKLIFNLSEYDPKEIAEIFSVLSGLYRAVGGDVLKIKSIESFELIPNTHPYLA